MSYALDYGIKHRNFFLKTWNKSEVFCSVCGQRIYQDDYHLNLHKSVCGFKDTDIARKLSEKTSFAYGFRFDENQEIQLVVCQPYLVPSPSTKKAYLRGDWRVIYTATFISATHEIKEHGLSNVDFWASQIDNKLMECCLNDIPYFEFFRKKYGNCLGFVNMAALLSIFRGGLLKERQVKEIPACFYHNLIEVKNTTMIRSRNKGARRMDCELVTNQGENFIHYDILNGFTHTHLVIGKDSIYVNREENTQALIHHLLEEGGGYQDKTSVDLMEKMDKLFPEKMIMKYIMEGGNNLFIPLLSGTYDSKIELIYKSGLSGIADNLSQIMSLNPLCNWAGTSVQEIFGIPLKTFRRLFHQGTEIVLLSDDYVITNLQNLYDQNPQLFSLQENYSVAALDYLLALNRRIERNEYLLDRDEEEKKKETKQELEILRYLNKPQPSVSLVQFYSVYKDYLRMCVQLNLTNYKRFPKDVLEAHDKMVDEMMIAHDRERNEHFQQIIQSEEYLAFTKEQEEGAAYLVVPCQEMADLSREGKAMHNCVATYLDPMCSHVSFIYFLRKSKSPDSSFCTIEINPDTHRLVQLKAFANAKPNPDTITWFKNYCRHRQIDTNHCMDVQ